MRGVFVSYARADGETKAGDLRERLGRDAPDITIKQDRLFLEGGTGWWKQITDAIDSVDFLVLLMTPAALASGNVQKEWRYARQQGVCVYPVKGSPDRELQFDGMPRWMRKAHFYELEKEWSNFLAHLRKKCETPRVPFMAPDFPAHFIERPAQYQALKNLLLTPDRSQPVAITTALSGAGGFGKTTLAAALCHDEDILAHYDDGILWATLGQTPNVPACLLTVYAALTGERPGFASVEDAEHQLGQKLADRNYLFVIDDVWDQEHLRPFLRGGKSSARLFTTRNTSIAAEASSVNVDQMCESEAMSMLVEGIPGLGSGLARELSRRLGEWPLALEIASAMIRERVRQGDSAGHAAERLLKIVDRKGVRALQHPTAERRHRTLSSVLEVSLELLDRADRGRLAALSIFPQAVAIPLAAAASVWALDEIDSEDAAERLGRLSLLNLDLERAVLRLHDVIRSWLGSEAGAPKEVHDRLVNAWPNWHNLPDLPGEYAWRWLPWHLARAERTLDIQRLLQDPTWMICKLKATDINALITDYELLKPSAEADLLQGALRLSAHVLAADARQFPSQMLGRLLGHSETPAIQRFAGELVAASAVPWLRPLRPALHPPGTELLRVLEGHSESVNGVVVTRDGKLAVSAAADTRLKVWDLETGRLLRTLEGHGHRVLSVAVTPDGAQTVSAAYNQTLKVWDLKTGRLLRTLEGHSGGVTGVAVTPDGKRAVSASNDKTLKVWDLESGRMLLTLKGHSGGVNGVAVTPDGKRVISASDDKTLKVWDLESGSTLHTLQGHSFWVTGVAVTPDGKRAVSASFDRTLKVWDLEIGAALHTIRGHSAEVTGVAVTPDGKRAVSASRDRTLKVWDVETGIALRTLEGHADWVTGVAVTPDGRRAVSASRDKTLKVWALETGSSLHAPKGHWREVTGVAVTPDGKRVVSASGDTTLKVWDPETGTVLRTLEGHLREVTRVAVTPDGKQAVSASRDKTLKVWNLETGGALRTLEGHAEWVSHMTVLPDGKQALVSESYDQLLKIWDLESGRVLRTLKGHWRRVTGVAVTPDGKRAVSVSADTTLKVWDLKSGRVLRTLEGQPILANGVAVTPDGKRAVVSEAFNRTVKAWDLETGNVLYTLEGHSVEGDFKEEKEVSGMAVTTDGKRVACAHADGMLRVWDLETGLPVAAFHCDAGASCCAFAGRLKIVAGDKIGRLHFLVLEEPKPGATLIPAG